jgi:hypothetical protein
MQSGITPALRAFLLENWPPANQSQAMPSSVGLTPTRTVAAAVARAITAVWHGQFVDDFYRRIHVVPSTINLGGLVSDQQRSIEVWNAHFGPRTLTTIDVSGGAGITVTGPAAPVAFTALQSVIYQFDVSIAGPPQVDAVYTFTFGSESPTLTVIGSRVIPFAFAPNWGSGFREGLSWLTDVIASEGAQEQTVILRNRPRRSAGFNVLAAGDEARRLDLAIQGWQSRVYAVPFWPDVQRLPSTVPAGSTTFNINTTDLDFGAGRLLMFWLGDDSNESAEIESVTPTNITLARPTINTWPVGTRCVPVRTARLAAQQSVSRATAEVMEASLAFRITGNDAPTPATGEPQYLGLPVFLRRPNRAAAIDADYARTVETFDARTGPEEVQDPSEQGRVSVGLSFVLRDRADKASMRAWLAARRGQAKPFWVPDWQRALNLVGDVSSTSATLPVAAVNYAIFAADQQARANIYIELLDGQQFLRGITGASAISAGVEGIGIDTPLGVSITPAMVRRLTWLMPARLASDDIEITHRSAGVAEITIPIVSVVL